MQNILAPNGVWLTFFLVAAVIQIEPVKCRCSTERIVGGVHAAPGEFPFMVRLITNRNSCGATIIDERHIVTAAHCLIDENREPAEEVTVYVGCHNKKQCVQEMEVSEWLVHENYNESRYSITKDIALVRTRSPIRFERNRVEAIERAESLNEDTKLSLTVLGWGSQFEGVLNEDPILRKVQVPFIPLKTCAKYYKRVDASLICAGKQGKDACQGDSGGPLVGTRKDGSRVLVGVVSSGSKCGTPAGGLYTRVAAYRDWITSAIRELEGGDNRRAEHHCDQ